MKVLFLVPYPLGQAPSQRFRFEQYFALLDSKGISYRVQSFLTEKGWRLIFQPGKIRYKAVAMITGMIRRIKALTQVAAFDIVFIHREACPFGPPVIEWMIVKVFRKKMIYDFDDAIWLANTSEENELAAFIKWHQKTN